MTEALSVGYPPSGRDPAPASQLVLDSLVAAEHARCLMCGPGNPIGPKLRFRVQPDGSVLAMFPCREVLRSYPETLHGGVISALLDAAMTNALFAIGRIGVTAELTVRFLAPVALKSEAVVHASVERDEHPLYHLRAELEQGRKLMARASAKFVIKGDM
jgi:acyl-coenzyme A thioesterase PaaI-like protein